MNGQILKRNEIFIIVALLFAAIITGCTAKTPVNTGTSASDTYQQTEGNPGIVWQEDSRVSFPEPYPYSDHHSTLTGTIAQADGAKYYFDSGISEEVRENALYRIEEIIDTIKSLAGESNNSCEVNISNDAYKARVYENQLYVGIESLNTQDSIVGIIQMLYGYQLNYGLAYALGCDVVDQLELAYDDNEMSIADVLAFVENEPAYLDLNYACFSETYANDEQLNNVKSLACHFYDYLCQQDKLDIFSQYSDAKYCSYLNQFLATYSTLTYDNSGLAETIFFDGGTKTQMAWKNHVADFYIEDGYTITYHYDAFEEDMLNSGYSNLRRIVVDYIAQADYMRAILKDFEIYTEDLLVLFMNDPVNARRGAAVYVSTKDEIRMFSIDAFMHEYTHYLTRGCVDGWKWEVLPTYYSNYPVDDRITYVWYADMIKRTSLDPDNPEEAEDYAFVQDVYASLEHEFDWTDMDDFQYLLDALLVKRGWLDRITDPNSGVATKSSFFHYLCKTYDEQTALSAFMFDDPEAYLGMTWEELITKWKDDVSTRLAWVNQ